MLSADVNSSSSDVCASIRVTSQYVLTYSFSVYFLLFFSWFTLKLFTVFHPERQITNFENSKFFFFFTNFSPLLHYLRSQTQFCSEIRCQLGPYCRDNPCKNSGKCIDSLDGPVCECEAGFQGDRLVRFWVQISALDE